MAATPARVRRLDWQGRFFATHRPNKVHGIRLYTRAGHRLSPYALVLRPGQQGNAQHIR